MPACVADRRLTPRYAYARDQLTAYVGQGFDLREAESAVSQDLGHGSGRDRWVSQIYLR